MSVNRSFAWAALGVALLFSLPRTGQGALPQTLNYQGRLAMSGGAPLPDSTGNTAVFRLYDALSGGTLLWTENWNGNVGTKSGLFNVVLGSLTPLSLPFDQPYWLEIQVNNDASPMSPRQPLTMAPYAFRARSLEAPLSLTSSTAIPAVYGLNNAGGNAALLSGTASGQGVLAVKNGAGGTQSYGILSVHNGTASTRVGMVGASDANFSNPSGPTGVYGYSAQGLGVAGNVDGVFNSGAGVRGDNSSSTGHGVVGYNSASTGNAVGVSGSSSSSTGIGVLGRNNNVAAAGGAGVYGENKGTGPGVAAAGAALALSVTSSSGVAIYAAGNSTATAASIVNLGPGHALSVGSNGGSVATAEFNNGGGLGPVLQLSHDNDGSLIVGNSTAGIGVQLTGVDSGMTLQFNGNGVGVSATSAGGGSIGAYFGAVTGVVAVGSSAALIVNGPIRAVGNVYTDSSAGAVPVGVPPINSGAGRVRFSAASKNIPAGATYGPLTFAPGILNSQSVAMVSFMTTVGTAFGTATVISPSGGTLSVKIQSAGGVTFNNNDQLNFVIINQ